MRNLKNEEKEPLYPSSRSEQALPRNTHADPFICNHCHKTASTPVISTCSHISCWKCIQDRSRNQQFKCATCHSSNSLNELRPIYISGGQHDHLHFSSRPKAKNIDPIRNPGRFLSQQVHMQHTLNNIQIGKQVPSACGLPSNFVLAFSDFSQNLQHNENQDEKAVVKVSEKLQKCLLISILLIVIGILFVSNRV